MKERDFDPRALDLAVFCRTAAALRVNWPLAGMARLAGGFYAATDAVVQASVQGSRVVVKAGDPETWLHVQARAEVPLQCQRCLQPMIEWLQLDRRLRFVRSEDEAARLDEDSDDDVLVAPARLDLHDLLEDELILALPLVPMHETCPEPLDPGGETQSAEEPAPHPFAALAALRGRPPGKGGTG